MECSLFQKTVREYYHAHKRNFMWRKNPSPYWVFVSEVMLQQTQTFRVEPKFDQFVKELPDFGALAQAPFAQVLCLWKGLGYNRRAQYLQNSAKKIIYEYAGELPKKPELLQELPGIGPATARSISVFAYNIPHVFIETNIRAVFIHHFFSGHEKVPDKKIIPLVCQTLDTKNPRDWYYALMDYGVHLKKLHKNPARKSAHHVRQSRFEGSDRQLRGKILNILLACGITDFDNLSGQLELYDAVRVARVLDGLVQEKLVQHILNKDATNLYYL